MEYNEEKREESQLGSHLDTLPEFLIKDENYQQESDLQCCIP